MISQIRDQIEDILQSAIKAAIKNEDLPHVNVPDIPFSPTKAPEHGDIASPNPAFGDGNRGQLPMDHSIVMYGRIEAFGDSIKVYYGPKFAEDAEAIVASQAALFPLQLGQGNAFNVNGATPVNRATVEAGLVQPIIDVNNRSYSSGSVGIWLESQREGLIDNLTITDANGLEGGTAVDARDKLTTQWGAIKNSHIPSN